MKKDDFMERKKGAEATVTVDEKVEKKRHAKNYRHKKLDERIRNERTSSEARILKEASRAGTNVPEVLEKKVDSILMEKIEGEVLRKKPEERHFQELGEQVAKLHKRDIIHGDLTTSNCIVNEKVYLIDFGLSFKSERIEDKAVDLNLLKHVTESSHPENWKALWNSFREGYSKYSEFEEVMSQLEEVEKRGRYK